MTRGPYLQSVTDRSLTLVCKTDTSASVTLRYGRYAGPPWEFETSSPSGQVHVFALSGLRPETRYSYELTAGSTVLARGDQYYFRTAPPEKSRAPFRFLAWGDSGTGTTAQFDVADRMAEVRPVPQFALGLGDLVYEDGARDDYDPKLFTPYEDLFPNVPFWPTLGNHDVETENGAPYFEAFYLPTSSGAPGHPSNTERYYSFDHGMAHFTCVDSELSSSSPGSAMYDWIEDDLASARSRGKRWLIVFLHRPVYSDGTHDSNSEGSLITLREDLVPLFEAQGVDLVAAGHSHNYERSFLSQDGEVLQTSQTDYTKIGTPDGTIYMVSGCGGRSGGGGLDHPLMARSYGGVNGFSLIDVSWEELRGIFIERDGDATDIFTLHKATDTIGPRVAALEALDSDDLELVFDEPVKDGTGSTGAENLSNYVIQPSRSVVSATLQSDRRTVLLRTQSLQTNRAYQLTVAGVEDVAGNEVEPYERGWFALPSASAGPPVAVLSSEVHTANLPATIAFSGARSTDGGGPVASVRWDFGDGSPVVQGSAAQHLYDATGLYTASMIVADSGGLESVARLAIRIHSQGNAPVANLSASPTSPQTGQSVSFGSSGSQDPDGGSVYLSWDFGDPASGAANRSTQTSPSHAYATAGSYTVVLTVVDDEGSTVIDTAQINVGGGGGPGPSGTTFTAVADAQVNSSNTNSNFGSDSALRLRGGSSEYRSFVRFQVSGLSGSVSAATLRLFVTDASDDGGTAYGVSTSWTEGGITWSNAPSLGSNALDSAGAVNDGAWADYDVTDHVTGDGTFAFGLSSESSNSTYFSSREGAHPPQLVIATAAPQDTAPPQVTGRSPAPGATGVSASTDVTASFNEPVQGVSGSTFTLRQGTTSVAANVSYDAATRTARLNPNSNLADGLTYTASLTNGIRDLAGNALAALSWTFTVAGGQPPQSGTTFSAVADAQVNSSNTNSNFGSDDALRVRGGGPEYESFVRFQVSGLTGSVSVATLRLFVTDASDDGGTVYGVSTSWTEGGITWSNAPSLGSNALDSAGAVDADDWAEYDVTDHVTGDGTFAFGLSSESDNSAYFSSREGAHPPQLVIATAAPQDTTPPQVTGRSPAPGATGVSASTDVTATFDEPVQGVSGSTFTLRQGTTSVAANVSYDAATRTARLDPTSNLAAGLTYTAGLTSGIRDLTGNALAALSWTFTVAGTPPSGGTTFTANADAYVRSNSTSGNAGSDPALRVRGGDPEYRSFVKFQVSGLAGSVSSATLRLLVTDASDDAGTVYGVSTSWTEGGITWSNAPSLGSNALDSAGAVDAGDWAEYDVTEHVTGDGTFAFGLSSDSDNSAYFSSRQGANPPQLVIAIAAPPQDTTPPQVSGRSPAPGATGVSASTNVTATFNEAVQGVSGSTFTLRRGTTSVSASVSYDAATRTARLDPSSNLAAGTTYTASLTSGIRDLAGNALAALSWTFTVAGTPAPSETTFTAMADAFVRSNSTGGNAGSDPALRVRDGDPEYRSYLRFQVSGLDGSVTSATLRLFVTDDSDEGGSAYGVSTSWTEGGITWNNAPSLGSNPLDTADAVNAGTWVEWDVTDHVDGDGTYAFGLSSTSDNSAYFSSREGSNPPQLVVETSSP